MSEKIEKNCRENSISLIGKIGFDKCVIEAMVEEKTIMESLSRPCAQERDKDSPLKGEVQKIRDILRNELSRKEIV